METEDTFKPEKLVGKRILIQSKDNNYEPYTIELGKIEKHYKMTTMGWTYKGRGDIVSFEAKVIDRDNIDLKWWSSEYRTLLPLIEHGEFEDKHTKYKII